MPSPQIIGPDGPVDIVVVDYDPAWPARYELERAKVVEALGDRALEVHHMGSTSVPGLAAKPIIDMNLAVADSGDEDAYVPDLIAAGYEMRVRDPGWHEHRMLRTPAHDVHLHVFTVGSSEIARNVRFRDRLRADDADRGLYQATKRELAARDWPTMQHYADAKTEVVADILSRA
jgi:GrpB-like predicted nucleotidyltransferase (UPF0157 family)